jgi:hypothetical protein
MNELAYISQLPETRAQIELFSNNVINIVKDGNANALEVTTKLKAIEEAIKKIRDGISDEALEEAAKHGKSFDFGNAKIEIANVGVRYDFSKCNDGIWNDLDAVDKDAQKAKKERETFLKSIKGQMTIVNEITGEIETIYQPNKSGKESIKITLK